MKIASIENIGKEYEVLGLVKGEIVQSKHFGKDFMSAIDSLRV